MIAANKELPEGERRACNTTNICTTVKEGHQVIIYITDNKYCGENFGPLLEQKKHPNHYIRIVVDASTKNIPHVNKEMLKRVIVAYCWAHARRKFYELLEYYPEECAYFLELIGKIYAIDNRCKHYSKRKRLKTHQRESVVYVKGIYSKIDQLFKDKIIEPNSSLGKAMKYWLNHKAGLIKFLKIKGIALDNNLSERQLKNIIRQRKNSLFFKTQDSAEILSGMSSIVASCEANQVNPFQYLIWIQRNWTKVQKQPNCYMPWDYLKYLRDTERIAA